MSRFPKFVAITSLLLICIYVFYPTSSDAKKDFFDMAAPVVEVDSTTETQFTSHIIMPPLSDEELGKLSLRAKLENQFPYDVSTVFPSFIWQTWRSTPADEVFEFRDSEASWSEHHPDFVHEVITDKVADLLISHLYKKVPEVMEAYRSLPKPVLKADFFRYLILLARGGVYSDIDTAALKPASAWVPQPIIMQKYGLVIGIEADPDREDWEEWYSRRIQFCQWTMRSKPGHPVLVEAVARLVETTMGYKQAGTLKTDGLKSIVEWTGPAMWTDVIFDFFNSVKCPSSETKPKATTWTWRDLTGMTEPRRIGDVVILPITGFSPGQGHMGSLSTEDPHACVKHDFEGSWKPESERVKPIV